MQKWDQKRANSEGWDFPLIDEERRVERDLLDGRQAGAKSRYFQLSLSFFK